MNATPVRYAGHSTWSVKRDSSGRISATQGDATGTVADVTESTDTCQTKQWMIRKNRVTNHWLLVSPAGSLYTRYSYVEAIATMNYLVRGGSNGASNIRTESTGVPAATLSKWISANGTARGESVGEVGPACQFSDCNLP